MDIGNFTHRVGAGAAHTTQMRVFAQLHKLKRADVVQGMNKSVSLGTVGSCLRILPEPGFCQGLGFFLLLYWEAGSLSLILGAEIEPIVSHPQKVWISYRFVTNV